MAVFPKSRKDPLLSTSLRLIGTLPVSTKVWEHQSPRREEPEPGTLPESSREEVLSTRYVSSAGLPTPVRKKKLIRVVVTIDIKDAFNSRRS